MPIEDIDIHPEKIKDAQEEMKIISGFVFNNTKIIMLTRNFLVVALTGLITFILYKKESSEFFWAALTLVIAGFLIELTVTSWQNAHMNRLWQLDRAINRIITVNKKNVNNIIRIPDVFAQKDIGYQRVEQGPRNYEICSSFFNTIKSFSFLSFYVLIAIIVIAIWLAYKSS